MLSRAGRKLARSLFSLFSGTYQLLAKSVDDDSPAATRSGARNAPRAGKGRGQKPLCFFCSFFEY